MQVYLSTDGLFLPRIKGSNIFHSFFSVSITDFEQKNVSEKGIRKDTSVHRYSREYRKATTSCNELCIK